MTDSSENGATKLAVGEIIALSNLNKKTWRARMTTDSQSGVSSSTGADEKLAQSTDPEIATDNTIDFEPEEKPATTAEKASGQLTKLVGKVIDTGVGPLTGSIMWAEDRLARVQGTRYEPNADPTRKVRPYEHDDIEKTIKRLIVESVEAAGVNGFVTGLGGFIAMPVTVPANMAGALVINARLAAAIAYLRGYDPKDPHVRTVATLIAVGSNGQQIAKVVGIKVGEKVAMEAIKKLPIVLIREINKKAGFMLLAKYGTKRSVVTLAKGVPLVGGVIGGAVDATMTSVIGRTARGMFPLD
ncbi:EcsC family protein [Arthrobacter sp. NPDC089319]|uniref:EcsC family protein n=1 Tax=Arthrobacter sp. NPDC089319 TaxID=3155915 RepID=UPI00344AFB5A